MNCSSATLDVICVLFTRPLVGIVFIFERTGYIIYILLVTFDVHSCAMYDYH